ncbi:MAG: methionine--tRNA ligase [Planctomycetes bacterium]|nr:methionine--tRNA ligase [Planctomycetota bacterium]
MLVTSALPYANGHIHIGHLVEYIQTDIWVRFQKLRGQACTYVCADDTHGTPIMIRARREGITPEELIARMHAEHVRDFADFEIEFDNYYSTHSPENRELAEGIYKALEAGGHITVREVEQAYCEKDQMWLPDRFLKGTCPKCRAADQYGDSCDACGATYRPTDLIDARCSVCGTAPVRKLSDHYFFKLDDFATELRQWVGGGHVHPAIANKLQEWFTEGLRDWDISRDGPYFGFLIPGTEDKYFYVWLDAPIGYIASFRNLCARTGQDFDAYWKPDRAGETELYHFIGKDITYFHALFWPAMLLGSGYRTPTQLAIHGFLTVDGQKMSKSRGTFIQARTFSAHLPPQALRYYYASKLGPGPEDLDLSLEDFVNRINAELVGKLANLLSRTARMILSKLDGQTCEPDPAAAGLIDGIRAAADEIAEHYESRNFALAVRRICALADEANRYLEETQPWQTVKSDAELARRQLSAALEAARLLAVYLKPIIPGFVARAEACLAAGPLTWASLSETPAPRTLGEFQRLADRIDAKAVEALIDQTRQDQAADK